MAKGVKRSAHPDGELPAAKAAKKVKTAPGPAQGVDDDGAPFWQISAKRRINVSEFKGATYVNIREFFEANGKLRPGKGVALTPEQWAAVIKLAPAVNEALAARGIKVDLAEGVGGAEESEGVVEEKAAAKPEPEPEPSKKKNENADKKAKKANIEATSESEGE